MLRDMYGFPSKIEEFKIHIETKKTMMEMHIEDRADLRLSLFRGEPLQGSYCYA